MKRERGWALAGLIGLAAAGLSGCYGKSNEAGPAVAVDVEALYAQMCARCHGPDGRGDAEMKKTIPGIRDFADPAFRVRGMEDVEAVIMTGKNQMPGFGGALTRPKIQHLGGYVRRLGDLAAAGGAAPAAKPQPVPGAAPVTLDPTAARGPVRLALLGKETRAEFHGGAEAHAGCGSTAKTGLELDDQQATADLRLLGPDAGLNPDWRWQLRHRISSREQLEQLLTLTPAEVQGMAAAPDNFRVGITPYYFSLIDRAHASCPVRMQVIPRASELVVEEGELLDPLGEDAHRPVPAIFHRYPDRCLLLALDRCAIYCRHCNRRRLVGQEESAISRQDLDDAVDYIRRTPAIRDVLISGGDPLTLSTDRLEEIIAAVRSIPHVEIIRIGTRVPVVLPMRIDDQLCAMLRRYHPLFVNTHFNHPVELTPQSRAACERLADAGIPIGNQTVLLRGVNSSARVLRKLFTELLRCRVRPYYLFQGDVAEGTGHLRTSVETGIALMEQLRGHISGLAVPHLVIDTPGGMGKVSIGPDYVVARAADKWVLRNYEGHTVEYPQPRLTDPTCEYDDVYFRA